MTAHQASRATRIPKKKDHWQERSSTPRTAASDWKEKDAASACRRTSEENTHQRWADTPVRAGRKRLEGLHAPACGLTPRSAWAVHSVRYAEQDQSRWAAAAPHSVTAAVIAVRSATSTTTQKGARRLRPQPRRHRLSSALRSGKGKEGKARPKRRRPSHATRAGRHRAAPPLASRRVRPTPPSQSRQPIHVARTFFSDKSAPRDPWRSPPRGAARQG